jgi:hypothetical protein
VLDVEAGHRAPEDEMARLLDFDEPATPDHDLAQVAALGRFARRGWAANGLDDWRPVPITAAWCVTRQDGNNSPPVRRKKSANLQSYPRSWPARRLLPVVRE